MQRDWLILTFEPSSWHVLDWSSFQSIFYIGHFYRPEFEIYVSFVENLLCRMKVLLKWWNVLKKWLIRLPRKSRIISFQGKSFFILYYVNPKLMINTEKISRYPFMSSRRYDPCHIGYMTWSISFRRHKGIWYSPYHMDGPWWTTYHTDGQ